VLRRRPSCHIVNIASINAYLPIPLTVRTTYRSLVYRCALSDPDGGAPWLRHLRELCLPRCDENEHCASFAYATEADATDFEARARLAPEAAARAILRGVQKDREVIVVGLDARAAAMARRLAPNLTRRVLALAWQRLASNAKKVK
jgi:short-subunit dehydrogenase